jgi:hypothetical protein
MQFSSHNFTVQTSRVLVYFKFELKSLWHRNTPPFIIGYNSFKTKLYTAHNKSTCCGIVHSSNTGPTSCCDAAMQRAVLPMLCCGNLLGSAACLAARDHEPGQVPQEHPSMAFISYEHPTFRSSADHAASTIADDALRLVLGGAKLLRTRCIA